MKRALLLFISLSSVLLASPEENYINFVRQVQADGSGEWDLWDLAPQGEALSYEGVGEAGSDFELWSVHSPTGEMFPLDSQFVAGYIPTATLEIVTGDPHTEVNRTRADKGFTLFTEIAGLIDSASVTESTPVAAQRVVYTHETADFSAVAEGVNLADVATNLLEQRYIVGNGGYPNATGQQVFPVTNISGPDLTQVQGEERFTITALADYDVLEAVIETATVQVWPVASGEIEGFDGTYVFANVPPLTITVTDLYPISTTWVQVYLGVPGSPPAEDDVIVITDTVFPWDAATSTDRTFTISSLEDYLEDLGAHTIQVIHETPWGQEILTEEEFSLDRRLRVRGNLNSK